MIHVLIDGFGPSDVGWQIAAIDLEDVSPIFTGSDSSPRPADVVICGPDSSRSPHELASVCGARILLDIAAMGSDVPVGSMGRSAMVRRWSVPLDAEGFGSSVIRHYRVSCHSVQSLHPPRRTHGPGAPLDEFGMVKLWDRRVFEGVGIPVEVASHKVSRELKLAMEGRRPLPILPGIAFCLPRSVESFPVEIEGDPMEIAGMLCHSTESALGMVLVTVHELVGLMGYHFEYAESLDWDQILSLVPIPFARAILAWCLESSERLPERQ